MPWSSDGLSGANGKMRGLTPTMGPATYAKCTFRIQNGIVGATQPTAGAARTGSRATQNKALTEVQSMVRFGVGSEDGQSC